MSTMLRLFALVCLICVTSAQLHQDPNAGVACYDCGGHGHHPFPACLTLGAKICHADEVCQVNYGGNHEVKIGCHRQAQCLEQVNAAGRQCSTGGAVVHDECQICCADATCVTDTTNIVQTNMGVSVMALHCPADCVLDNIATCVANGHMCHDNQFCQVDLDSITGHIAGHCKALAEVDKCMQEMVAKPCGPDHQKCRAGCCTNDTCIANTLKADATGSGSLWEVLTGNCVDSMSAAQCATLDSTQHLCGDRLALRLCPQTCGLCSAFQASQCADIVTSASGCAGLVQTEDICNHPLALTICPNTCNMCDQILENLINDALNNGVVATTVAAATTAATVLVHGTSDMPTTDQATSGLPDTTVMDTTVMDSTMMDSTAAAVTVAVCKDTIQQMSCSDVTDVCSSPLLANYCQHFCGLCQ